MAEACPVFITDQGHCFAKGGPKDEFFFTVNDTCPHFLAYISMGLGCVLTTVEYLNPLSKKKDVHSLNDYVVFPKSVKGTQKKSKIGPWHQ